MDEPTVLPMAEAISLLVDPGRVEALGQLDGRGLLVVDLADVDPASLEPSVAQRLAEAPCVTVGLVDPSGAGVLGLLDPDPRAAAVPLAFDVLLGPPGPAAGWRPVVALDEPSAALAELAAAVAAQPRAARVLVQVLRASAELGVVDGLVVESLAYSTLQAGPDFAAWRATRGPSPERPSSGPPVLLRREGSRLDLVLNRPEVHNAYSAAMRDGLVEGLELATLDPTIEVVHLSGAGPTFSSGGDLGEFGSFEDPASAHVVRTARSVGRLLAELPAEVVVHTHGACRGAGCELAAFAQEVTAASGTTFGLPEVSMGLIPGAGGTVSLPRRIGRHRTAWLALSGHVLNGAVALDWGLADREDLRAT